MLKINASFSKKVPVPGVEMSSQSYYASVEVEVSDSLSAEQLQQRIHRTFDLVRSSVESELHEAHSLSEESRVVPFLTDANGNNGNNGNGNGKNQNGDTDNKPDGSNGNKNNGSNGSGQAASAKQLRFLRDLSARQGIDGNQLQRMVQESFNIEQIDNLTRKQASILIDRLNGKQNKAGRSA